ncbi:MAG: methyltransferase domain-containing protein [Terracidiphilus sp.]
MAEGAKGTATDVYVLGTGNDAAERLRLLDKVFGPSTRKMLQDAGLGPGMRALDLACGIGAVSCWMASQVGPTGTVVAADVNPDQLVVSKRHCAKCEHLPIDYIDASAYETGFPDESFDLVHIRFLLCHLTEPAKVLREVYRVLKPGGALVCQDLRLSGTFCRPESRAVSRSIEISLLAGAELGVDYNYGERLPADAVGAGFDSVEVRLECPAYLSGAGKRLWELTFAEAVPVIAGTGVATEDELKGIVEEMRRLAEDERVLIAQWCSPGIIARK